MAAGQGDSTPPDSPRGYVQVLPSGSRQGQHVAPAARPFSVPAQQSRRSSPAEISCSSWRDRVDLARPKCEARSAARISDVTSTWVR
jgi:hypothetical protein